MVSASTKFLAKRLYVNDGWSAEDIASKCRVSKNTVINWRDNQDWKEQRAQFLESSESFSEECFLFATKVLRDMRVKYGETQTADNGQMKLLDLLLGRIEKVIEIDLKRREQNGFNPNIPQEAGRQIPVEVAADPEVAEMLEKIAKKIEAFERNGFNHKGE